MNQPLMNAVSKQDMQFRFLILLAIGYITSVLCSVVLFKKVILFDHYVLQAATITYALSYCLCDIIAEVYGYKAIKRTIWSAILCANLFALVTTVIIHMPSPSYYDVTTAYQEILGSDLRFTFAGTVSILVGSFANAYLFIKLKNLTQGRYFITRYACSIVIAEIIDTLIVFSIGFAGTLSPSKIMNIMVTAYAYKIIVGLLLAVPATLIVAMLKKAENYDANDLSTNFNPFKYGDVVKD